MRALLVSTYDLGRQPFGLASPAAWLRRAGIDVSCVDTSREALDDERIAAAGVIAFYLPMHTATRLAAPVIERVRRVNPSARLCAYGLYAPLNADWLHERGVTDILGPEAEQDLVDLVTARSPTPGAQGLPRLPFIQPDRAGLVPLDRYASLRMPDGTRRVIGSTDATRGCKHVCRHCPIVPVYKGHFRVVPVDVVMADVRGLVGAGAQHVTFGDPDFLNAPTHARRLVERFSRECPGVSYDATIKIEHLLQHAEMVPLLRDTGCLFVTSAVESIDDRVLEKLRKGHTRKDFLSALALCRGAGLTLSPTFIPFTPWTSLAGYVELLDLLLDQELVEQVAPIQLAIRLLVTAESPLLDLPEIGGRVAPFDHASLTWPWRHESDEVDALHASVMRTVREMTDEPRGAVFSAIATLARRAAGMSAPVVLAEAGTRAPCVSEPWYCCAEPMDSL